MLKKAESSERYEIGTAVRNNDEHEVTERVQELMVCLKHLYRTNEFSSLEQLVRIQSRKLARAADTERARHAITYHLGFTMGMLDILKEVLCCYHEQQALTQQAQENMQSKIPHVKEIVAILRQEPMTQHGKLAQRLGIDKSTLTPIIRQMEKSGMITVVAPGKFKYYSLSNAGQRFADRVFPFLPQNESPFYGEFGKKRMEKIDSSNRRITIVIANNQTEGTPDEIWNTEDWNNDSIRYCALANQ